MTDGKDYISTREVAAFLGLSPRTMDRYRVTSRSRSGSASMTSKTFSPNARTSLQALTGPIPRIMPEPRYFSVPAKAVRPFVGGNKNDAQDARAIWTAVQQPGIKTVAIKTEEQQAVLAMHRMRQQLVKFRTAQINGLRGLLSEYGEVMPQGRAGISRAIAPALERVSERLPVMIVETLAVVVQM